MAFDAFMKIDGIDGESTDAKHKDEIEILSYSWGLSNSSSAAGGGGGGAGKVQFQDFHFVSSLQKSSPKLFLGVATGEHFKKAVLTVRKSGGDGQSQDYYKVTMQDVVISSFQQSGTPDGGGDVPMEEISLNFSKITMDYRQQNADGTLGDPVIATWDLKKNKGA